MDQLTEDAIKAFVRLHKTTESLYADPNQVGMEEALSNAAREANELMRKAGLLGKPDSVILALVAEVFPGWKPDVPQGPTPGSVLSLLIPSGPLDFPPDDPRLQATGEAVTDATRARILRSALMQAGVGELGKWDLQVVDKLAGTFDWSVIAAVVSWIERAKNSTPTANN
ncbi:hypothetical protein ADK60_40340 [Streptomyces sp. XY431]|uniref:hypothetical protein n=1 Tax=Streptomyces sp. XY431 TaxID=1415562 RepID=UPI0006AF8CA2|nr:hypothetical protein [Streptomyces sp. XY431]KOV09625.1 hypothetical protein ADK60_40340 [Streptomyces sp. XY431]